jgi:hypothetical protein
VHEEGGASERAVRLGEPAKGEDATIMVENRGSSALLARAHYCGALMERLKMGRTASRTHPFRRPLEGLLAHVEQVCAGPTERPLPGVHGRDEHEELRAEYAPLFWHYLGRALQAMDRVQFTLTEACIRCLLPEFRVKAAPVLDEP